MSSVDYFLNRRLDLVEVRLKTKLIARVVFVDHGDNAGLLLIEPASRSSVVKQAFKTPEVVNLWIKNCVSASMEFGWGTLEDYYVKHKHKQKDKDHGLFPQTLFPGTVQDNAENSNGRNKE